MDSISVGPRVFNGLSQTQATGAIGDSTPAPSSPDYIDQLFNGSIPLSVRSLLYNVALFRETDKTSTTTDLLNTINIVYESLILEVDDRDRQKLFLHVIDCVRETTLAPGIIQIFIRFEPNHYLARSAVSAYLQFAPTSEATLYSATEQVIFWLTEKKLENRGAVFAGLICFGDRRVCAVARTIRESITPAEMRAFATAVSSPLNRAVFEFCLTWLVDLVNKENFKLGIAVATALSSIVIRNPATTVHDQQHNFGPYGFSSITASPPTSYDDLMIEMGPLLQSIEQVGHSLLNQMIAIIRNPETGSLEQIERRQHSSRRVHEEQRASDRRIVDIRPRLERRAAERRAEERRLDTRR